MALMFLPALFIGLGVLVLILGIVLLVHFKKRKKYRGGIKAANTSRIKQTPLYRKLKIRYRILLAGMLIGFVGSFISSLFLVARPYESSDLYVGVKKRDIVFCLDVSYSLYDLNSEITDYLKGMVKGLEGDRLGISIFNTSSVTYVPLTDDYDFIYDRLDNLSKYFAYQKEYYEEYYLQYKRKSAIPSDKKTRYEELREFLDYFESGTLCNNTVKGSSLIGEGLGTALYSFPYLGDRDRTRVIIMCTDNELNAWGAEVVNLGEASQLCKKNDVTLFGIFPPEEKFYQPEEFDYSQCLGEFKRATEVTGGQCYIRTATQSVTEIVDDIHKQEAMMTKVMTSRQTKDLPFIPFVITLILAGIGCLAGLVLQK